MRITTDPTLFLNDDLFEELIALMRLVRDARHHWDVDPESARLAGDYFDRFAPLAAQGYRQLMQKSVTAGAYLPPAGRHRPRITAESARVSIRDLERSALIVLENQESDGTFLRAVFRAFGRADLIDALESGAMAFRHAGGGGVMFKKIAMEAAREYGVIVRVCGVLDSDRLVPVVRTSAHRDADQSGDHGVTVLVLELREVENYIPPAALEPLLARPGVDGAAAALARLNSEQRGYYDMKKGFGATDTKPAAVKPAQADLFAELGQEQVHELGRGLGEKIINCLKRRDLVLTAADFEGVAPGARAEFDKLFAMIDEVL
ncbi:hypothetical protein [Frankia tisae]|uniref:hypothetical protein n=1 Tax=Frankia tisae TaxID=2950104 RepID=UPI0021C0B700|nr:hypothetical protein [Frankia tisae]